MNNSIENIWKSGFVNEPLNIPKINEHYNQKSLHQVEKLIQQFKREINLLIPIAALLFGINIWLDNQYAIFWGIVGAVPCVLFYFIGKKQIKSLVEMDYKSSPYNYLMSIRKKLVAISTYNKRLTIIGIPTLFFPLITYTYFNQYGKTIGEIFGIDGFDYPTASLFILLPIVVLISIAIGHFQFKKEQQQRTNKIDALLNELTVLNS